MSNSKLRKVCAVLCSGMCALGSANANPGKSDFIKSQEEEYLNRRIQENTEVRNKANPYSPFAPLAFGFLSDKYAESAMAIGALKVLKDAKILEYFEKGDVESLKKIAKNEKLNSVLVGVFLRWVTAPLAAGAGAFFGLGMGLYVGVIRKMLLKNADHLNVDGIYNKDPDCIISLILMLLASYVVGSSVAGVFNVLEKRLLGGSKEVQKMGKEFIAIMKRAESNILKEKSKKGSKGAPVKKGKNNLNSAIDRKANQKPGVGNATSTKQRVRNVNVVGKNSNKADKLSKSFGAAPVVNSVVPEYSEVFEEFCD